MIELRLPLFQKDKNGNTVFRQAIYFGIEKTVESKSDVRRSFSVTGRKGKIFEFVVYNNDNYSMFNKKGTCVSYGNMRDSYSPEIIRRCADGSN